MGSIRVVHGGEIAAGQESEGMTRRVTQVDEQVSLAVVSTEPNRTSSWHHHGEHTSYVYVLKGHLHIDWGPGGQESVDLASGDFYVISPNTIHREGNPGPEDQVLVAFYLGSGPVAVNLDEAEPQEGSTRTAS